MKHSIRLLMLCTLISSAWAGEECRMQNANQMIGKRNVGGIYDLVKTKSPGKCNVKFTVEVDGTVHNINWTHEDSYDSEVSCRIAIENGMNELYSRLPGLFETESITVCKEGSDVKNGFKPVEIGEEILETEVGYVSNDKRYFRHNGWSLCRRFQEQYNYRGLQIRQGIICRSEGKLWRVVEKW
jgi:hypothetical protein